MKLHLCLLLASASLSSAASACADKSETWYRRHSAAVIDGAATCDPNGRTCTIAVGRVLKNDYGLRLEHRKLEIDYLENPFTVDDEENGTLTIVCGAPEFEPEIAKFSGRFYLNWDQKSGEVSAWRFLVRDQRGLLRHPVYCEAVDGLARCVDPRSGE